MMKNLPTGTTIPSGSETLMVPLGTWTARGGAVAGQFLIPYGQEVSTADENEGVIIAPYAGRLSFGVSKLSDIQASNITCVVRKEFTNAATGPGVIAGQTGSVVVLGVVTVVPGDRISVQLNGLTVIDPDLFFYVAISILAEEE